MLLKSIIRSSRSNQMAVNSVGKGISVCAHNLKHGAKTTPNGLLLPWSVHRTSSATPFCPSSSMNALNQNPPIMTPIRRVNPRPRNEKRMGLDACERLPQDTHSNRVVRAKNSFNCNATFTLRRLTGAQRRSRSSGLSLLTRETTTAERSHLLIKCRAEEG